MYKVSISKNSSTTYLDIPPFHPSNKYAEYKYKSISEITNPAYEEVRNSLFYLGYDKDNYGTEKWNPLSAIIQEGDHVVIKPNFVLSQHYEGGDLFSVITHPSVIRAVIDYVYLAINGNGKITIADAPQMDCNFSELLEKTQLLSIQEFYKTTCQFTIDILDLREFWLDKSLSKSTIASIKKRKELPGDPKGSTLINLGERSKFYKKMNMDMIYGADYNRDETMKHHHGNIHEYSISNTILDADVIMSIPKLKVHKKVGVTLNAKGLVGINTNKNCLIHFTLGTPDNGGDQFPDAVLSKREKLLVDIQRYLFDTLLSKKIKIFDYIYQIIYKLYRYLIRPWFGTVKKEKVLLDAGNWQGNDSAWRMTVDLVNIALFADKNGKIQQQPQRKLFSVIDGIIGGEKNGPLTPNIKQSGVIISGDNPISVDIVAASLMGFNVQKIKSIYTPLSEMLNISLEDLEVLGVEEYRDVINIPDRYLDFEPHPGWPDLLNEKSF